VQVVWASCEFTCAAHSREKVIGDENENLNSQAQTRGSTSNAIRLLSGSIKGIQKTEGRGLLQCQVPEEELGISFSHSIYNKISTDTFKARMKAVVQKCGWKTNCLRARWMFRAETRIYWKDKALACVLSSNSLFIQGKS